MVAAARHTLAVELAAWSGEGGHLLETRNRHLEAFNFLNGLYEDVGVLHGHNLYLSGGGAVLAKVPWFDSAAPEGKWCFFEKAGLSDRDYRAPVACKGMSRRALAPTVTSHTSYGVT